MVGGNEQSTILKEHFREHKELSRLCR